MYITYMGNKLNNKKGEKMENLKIQLSNYAYMSYETYRVLKAKILELADKEIADLHEFMELATENEMERRAMCEDNSEIRQWEQRTKYMESSRERIRSLRCYSNRNSYQRSRYRVSFSNERVRS